MNSKQKFYDGYHKKNNKYSGIIKKNNFTYFEILRFFYDSVFAKFPKKIKKINILDVGCGVGTMALFFGSLGANVRGIDVSQRAIDIAKEARNKSGFKNVIFAKQLLKAGKQNYDMVLISEVIEHVEDENQFLKLIASNLNKNGLLFLTTPSKDNFLYRIGFYKKFDNEVGHLRRYTQESISELLEKNGFEILHLKKVEGPLRNLLFTTGVGFLIRFIRGPLIPIFHFFDHITIHFFGAADIIILAKKSS
ncbi:methyltransferase domain-containing protein [Candidatus Woesebacteria bacterium]|nr:methyltransferase domain-containing protein [Candidatus Woesebacteria bacterium]